ncbi:MAG TPA: hypothetical protein VFV50_01395 [Bdellovibrionales bacterium]|nr:hypothetical protein [Bdellovibrionales bacterium]
MKKLRKRVQETASKASGQLKGLAAKAKSLESVLADIKSRDFLQSAKMQDLMAKVTVKGLNSVPFINRNQKSKKDEAKPKAKNSESAFRGRLKTLENQINSKVARDLIMTIMKRADEIKQAYFNGEPDVKADDIREADAETRPAPKGGASAGAAAGSVRAGSRRSAKPGRGLTPTRSGQGRKAKGRR